jgi:hypothetical protein
MMPELSLSEIQQRGYREDDESRRAFERRYRWVTAPAIAVILGAACLATQRTVAGFLLFFGGLLCCFGAAYHAHGPLR